MLKTLPYGTFGLFFTSSCYIQNLSRLKDLPLSLLDGTLQSRARRYTYNWNICVYSIFY